VFGERGVIRAQNLLHHKTSSPLVANPRTYRIKDEMVCLL
jgi:hypothetical protein